MSIGKRRSNLTKLTAAGVVIVALLGGVEKFFNITERLIPDRESYQDIVTRNHNPTNVVLAEVGVQHMLGDPDSSLVVKYQNVTEMPARSFSVKANLGAEELPEFRSAIYKGFDPATLGIIPKSALEMPVASISGLEERVGGSICGVGLRPVDLGGSSSRKLSIGGAVAFNSSQHRGLLQDGFWREEDHEPYRMVVSLFHL